MDASYSKKDFERRRYFGINTRQKKKRKYNSNYSHQERS